MANQENIDYTKESLSRIQEFDSSCLGREEDLGKKLSFTETIHHADKIINLYRRIPISILQDLNNEQLNNIKTEANSDFNLFNQVLDFDVNQSNASTARKNLIESIKNRRDSLFSQLWQFIAYGVARITDTSLLESQARSTIQDIKDQSNQFTSELSKSKSEAETILATIRGVASEQGVSQQAIYFKEEAQKQDDIAQKWLEYTFYFGIALGLFAILSLVLHKIEFIKPSNNGEMFQLITSKILIFGVLAFMLIMASRNYFTHKHNAVINRHRQNALLTYRALVSAAEETATQDIVLAHAASCIFSPQETGFTNGRNESSIGSKSVLELLTKSTPKSTDQ